jgi:hypothetical protein
MLVLATLLTLLVFTRTNATKNCITEHLERVIMYQACKIRIQPSYNCVLLVKVPLNMKKITTRVGDDYDVRANHAVDWRATYGYKKFVVISRRYGLWVLSGSLPVRRCQLEPEISFRHFFWVSWGIFGSPVLVRHLWRVFLEARHFCLHEFIICGKLLAPAATRGPHCWTSEPTDLHSYRRA